MRDEVIHSLLTEIIKDEQNHNVDRLCFQQEGLPIIPGSRSIKSDMLQHIRIVVKLYLYYCSESTHI